jgi:hypothetical protein
MKIKAEYWQGNRGNGGQAQRELFWKRLMNQW